MERGLLQTGKPLMDNDDLNAIKKAARKGSLSA
jgi:hypothetical protein